MFCLLMLAALAPASGGGSGLARGDAPPTAGTATEAAPVVLDVPFLPQSERLCGGAAAAMVLRYWGRRDVQPEDFAALVEPAVGGIRAERLAAGLPSGFQAHVAAADAAAIRHHLARGRPPIALVELAPGRRHYVVVVAWQGERVLYHDPADRPFRVAHARAFERGWAASGRLMLLIVPAADAIAPREDAPRVVSDDGHVPDRCGGLVSSAVALARVGDLDGADLRLEAASALCPGASAAARERAGVRFRQQRYADAAVLASAAVAAAPRDTLAWRLLATSRFLAGDESGALAAWNAVGEPDVDLVAVEGLDRTRPAVVSARLGIAPRSRLEPGPLRRASRRLADMPTFQATRLRYRPLGNGRVELTASVVERPLVDPPLALALQIATDAATRRETRVGLASTGHEGGWLEAGGRWQEHRPAAWLSLDAPGALGLPGLARLELLYDEQRYSFADAAPVVERRRRVLLRAGEWLAADLHAAVTLGLERNRPGGTTASAALRVERRLASDRVSLAGRLVGGVPLGEAARFAAAETRLAFRTTASGSPPLRLSGRLGASGVSADAPLAFWPGAGTGVGRELLLRAHPLLDEGIVAGDAFGRRLLDAGLELDAALLRLGPATLRLAAFADAARPWQRSGLTRGHWLVDVGAGLRIGVGGTALRIDVATAVEPASGGATVSAGWLLPWPR